MAFTNLLKKQVDLPVWEWMRFVPSATAAGSALCSVDDGSGRYMYFVTSAVAPNGFWRYDTYSDGWIQLASPNVATATSAALKYSAYGGWRGKVLAATSTTFTSALLNRGIFNGMKVRIMSGTGAGQERTITNVTDPVIADSGFFSAVSGVATATDGLKKWKINQWAGYQCRTTYGTGQGQVRKILYNDATMLYFYDINYQQSHSWGNTGWSAALPYAAPAAQTGYVIESSTATVPTWDTAPDATSSFAILSGSVWLVSSAGTPSWSSVQCYDIASDTWYTKTAIAGNISAALGTDWSIDRTGEVGGAFAGPYTASAGAARTITIGTTPWTVDQYSNYQIRIASGTGKGQRRRIEGNTSNTITIERNWDINPSTDSIFSIYANTDLVYLAGNANAALLGYNIEQDIWGMSSVMDWGTARIGAVSVPGASGWPAEREPIAITSIVRVTNGILSCSAVFAAGSGYKKGDVLTCATGTLGTFLVTEVTTTGGVVSVELMASGSGYTAGNNSAAGGSGTLVSLTITVGTTALVTTAINHGLPSGKSIVISGATGDTSWNASWTILGVGGLATFSLNATGTTATPGFATGTLSATLLVDVTKSWSATGTGEHTGRLMLLQAPGPAPAAGTGLLVTRITSNTANTITFTTNNVPVNGTWRYCILGLPAYGSETIYKGPEGKTSGYVTSATSTQINDTTKEWLPGMWIGYAVRCVQGTGNGNEAVITANTATQLTVASWNNATPDTTTKYVIMDSFGTSTSGSATVINDTTKNWPVNSLINKRVKVQGGIGFGVEATITANTATQLTATVGTVVATTSYTILAPPASGTNSSLQWIFGGTSPWKGKGLLKARGNCPQFDCFDITTEKWDLNVYMSPSTESMVVGSMYTYDGEDRLYFTIGATGRVQCIYIPTWNVRTTSTTPYAHGTGLAGNRMETVLTADGLKYLYIMRHTGQEMWRSLIFWES